MNSKQDENEPVDHYELRFLLEEAKPILQPMSPDQQWKWVAESRLAQEIYTILRSSLTEFSVIRRERCGNGTGRTIVLLQKSRSVCSL